MTWLKAFEVISFLGQITQFSTESQCNSFVEVCTPIVTYNLKIYSPFMASSPQLSGQSIVLRKRSQSGWRSCSGELAVFFIFYFFTFLFNHLFLFSFYTKLTNRLECLRILLFSYFIRQGFLLLIGKFTLFHTIKVMTCIGMPRNLSIVKSNNKEFGDVFVLQVSGRFESKNFQFRMFSHLILAVCSPLVTYEIRICCRVKPRFKICYELKTVFKKPTDKGPLQNSNIFLKSVHKT